MDTVCTPAHRPHCLPHGAWMSPGRLFRGLKPHSPACSPGGPETCTQPHRPPPVFSPADSGFHRVDETLQGATASSSLGRHLSRPCFRGRRTAGGPSAPGTAEPASHAWAELAWLCWEPALRSARWAVPNQEDVGPPCLLRLAELGSPDFTVLQPLLRLAMRRETGRGRGCFP